MVDARGVVRDDGSSLCCEWPIARGLPRRLHGDDLDNEQNRRIWLRWHRRLERGPLAFGVTENATTSGDLVATSTTVIYGLEPGRSYPFYLLVRANYGSDNPAISGRATVRVTIDGSIFFQRSTRGTDNPLLIVTNSNNPAYTAYAPLSTFVATATTATLTYTTIVQRRGGNQANSDDIFIQAPTWTNCTRAPAPLMSCPAPMSAFTNTVSNGRGAGNGTFGWDNLGGAPATASGALPQWSVSRDSATGFSFQATTTGTMTGLVPGLTYSVAVNVKSTYGNNDFNNSIHTVMQVFVGGTTNPDASVTDGTRIFAFDTRREFSDFTWLNTGSGTYDQYVASFTAAAESMSIAYSFAGSQFHSPIAQDDIQITAPQFINCA